MALEPDPDNLAKHARQIALNDLGDSWSVIAAAATCAEGPVSFTVGQATTGRMTDATEHDSATVAGRDVYALLDGVDLLKIDIEGAEWEIVSDARLGEIEVPVVMLEYHPHRAPSARPQEDARQALESAGYTTEAMHAAPDGTGVVWGWRAQPRD